MLNPKTIKLSKNQALQTVNPLHLFELTTKYIAVNVMILLLQLPITRVTVIQSSIPDALIMDVFM